MSSQHCLYFTHSVHVCWKKLIDICSPSTDADYLWNIEWKLNLQIIKFSKNEKHIIIHQFTHTNISSNPLIGVCFQYSKKHDKFDCLRWLNLSTEVLSEPNTPKYDYTCSSVHFSFIDSNNDDLLFASHCLSLVVIDLLTLNCQTMNRETNYKSCYRVD